MRLSNLTFRSRIVVVTLLATVISGIASGAAIFWNSDQVARYVLLSRTQIEAKIISENIAASVLFDDSASASEILATIKADAAVMQATLTKENGEVFSRYQDIEFREGEANTIHILRDIVFEGRTIGHLEFVVSKQEVYEQNFANISFLAVLLCLVSLLVYLLIRPIVGSILVPLLNLHNVTEKIASTRDYALRVPIKSDDEIGQVSQMFNHMVEQIEHRDVMLEKQVGQRTNQLEKLAEEFRFRAFHDSLTGLPNRALLHERFEFSVQHARRSNSYFALLLLDLDDFKTINDTKGHEFGDDLLIDVASRLKDNVRAEDMVCRLGGDEFVVLLNDLKQAESVEAVAEKILRKLGESFTIKHEKIRTAVSIGGAVFPLHGENLSTIKRNADVAMYRAKDAGKNRFCLFSKGMEEDVKYRLMIQTDLRTALNEKQLEVYLQPKVDPARSLVLGCEALVRWNHPTEGFLTPNKFVPYAEEVGMIAEIDYFVIRRCCELQVEWESILTQPIPIAFNLSGRHFHDNKIVHVLADALEEYGINPDLLEAEITEAVLIQDPDKAQKIVREVKALGLGISLDDFGTGYSSLNYLRTLPIDTVKLDRSFVAGIDTNLQDRRLTRGIVSLAKGLDLRLVAEGVENENELATLQDLGCHCMQGYYFLPPAPNHEFLQWYLKNYSLKRADNMLR